MVFNVTLPVGVRLKMLQKESAMMVVKKGDIHYIGGCEVLPAPLNVDEENRRISQLGTEEEYRARAILIEHNLRLVVYIAKKFDNTGVGVEDLISIGTIGLIKAVDTFKIANGAKFATYAARCIQNEILMHFRSQKKQAAEISLNDTIDVDRDGNPLTYIDVISCDDSLEAEVERKIRSAKARSCVDTLLSPRERKIISMRYGLDGRQPLTQREIAEALKISRSYVSRIEKNALDKLREAME